MNNVDTSIESNTKEQLDVNEQILLRKQKLKDLREQGQAYPNNFKKQHFAADLLEQHNDKDKETLESEANKVSLAGRIMMQRIMGKASFIHIQDMTGRMQLYLRQNDLPAGVYDKFKTWDIGDIIGVKGEIFKTKTGELSVKVSEIDLLTKALRPLPDKWHGLNEKETCYRQRYLDLIVNQQSREVFIKRAKIIQVMREFFLQRRYMEVETPMMQAIPGGATARPFVTHHNALDMDLYLRVAPELYLKRLVVGGFERVFEINRNFRNEGVSTRHNPEFTMVEFYQAYATYHDMIELTEELFKTIVSEVCGGYTINYQGNTIDFSQPFAQLTVIEAILKYNSDLSTNDLQDKDKLISILQKNGAKIPNNAGIGKLQMELFEATAEHLLIQPTFITQFPKEVSPLSRCNDDIPEITDRFELFIAGREIANAFSELNDPEDQYERFMQQVADRESGDHEAMHMDYDYILALEHGLPPTAGEGIGIDRLVMLFTDAASIRDVLLFPHMRHSQKKI